MPRPGPVTFRPASGNGTTPNMQDKSEILAAVTEALVELFELEPERIRPEARLYEDLEVDSIDAIDLLDRLRRQTGQKIAADRFRSVATVSDLVDAVHVLVREG